MLTKAVQLHYILTKNILLVRPPSNSCTDKLIIEWFWLEGAFKSHLAKPPYVMSRDIFNWTSLWATRSNLTLNASRDGVAITNLGNLL